jgi:hypothetical protein
MCMHIFNSQQNSYCNIVYILVRFLPNEVELPIKLLKESQQGVIKFLNKLLFSLVSNTRIW